MQPSMLQKALLKLIILSLY